MKAAPQSMARAEIVTRADRADTGDELRLPGGLQGGEQLFRTWRIQRDFNRANASAH